MQLQVNQKSIDTGPIKHLITQGETGVDRIAIKIPRYYGNKDLGGLSFVMSGTTENGNVVNVALDKYISDDVVMVSWTIGKDFTEHPGAMALELTGLNEEQELIIKFTAGPIFIRPELEV